MNLHEVKEYLRIDGDADDATLEMMMQAAEQFIIDAAGFYDPENPKVKILYALLMQDFYENRVFAIREADRQRLSQVAGSILLQLQMEALLREEETDG